MRILLVVPLVVLRALTVAAPADACCNVIPSASTTFHGPLGTADRPFSAPGEFVQLGLDTAACDAPSAGFAPTAAEHVVTVVFTPPAGGPQRVVVLAAGDCAANPLRKKLDVCGETPGVASVACISAGPDDLTFTGTPPRLAFRFPDTDAVFAPAGDGRTLTGPARIVVTRATEALPCGLATTRCADAVAVPGLVACLDDFFVQDGTCRTDDAAISRTFPHFTALPVPNDYGALCTEPAGLCTGAATEARFTVDAGGNVLLPVDWRSVLVRDGGAPVPRLLHGSTSIEAFAGVRPIRLPGPAFLASYTPEGILLPPIFVPQQDPSAGSELSLFGSSDAPYSILRIGRRGPDFRACDDDPTRPCVDDGDCPGGTCVPATCVSGTQAGHACTTDADCPGGECGPAAFDLSALIAGGGPAVLPRVATTQGVCESGSQAGQACTPGTCAGGSACVNFRSRAEDAVPLAGLSGTPELFALTASEQLTGADLDGDGDQLDLALTLRDRATGGIEGSCSIATQSCLTDADCSAGTCVPIGRAVASIAEPPFSFPTVEAEGNVVAFLEPEPAQGETDKNGDGDVADTILRVFRTGGAGSPEVTAGRNLAADAAPLVNGRSVAISGGTVFFRRPEREQVRHVTERVSVLTGGFEANGASFLNNAGGTPVSSDGRFVGFVSQAANLGTVGLMQAFLRDRVAGTTEMVSVDDASAPLFTGPNTQNGFGGISVSGDGRFVAFNEVLDPGVVQNEAALRDRTLGTTRVVSTTTGGSAGNADSASPFSGGPAISADGRWVAFGSVATNFAPGTTVDCSAFGEANCQQIYLKDTVGGTTELVSVTTGGQVGNNHSQSPIVSADGRWVMFSSFSTNLAVGDANVCAYVNGLTDPGTCADVFLRDRSAGTTELVSRGMDGFPANGVSQPGDVSPDGRYVVFVSNAPNIVATDTVATCDENGDSIFDESCTDVFVLDRQTGTFELETVDSAGEQANADSGEASISADGRYVSFASLATNLVPGVTPGTINCYVHDRLTGVTQIASQRPGGAPAQSPFMADCRLSADGMVTVFDNYDDQVTPPDNNTSGDVFARAADVTDTGADITGDGAFDDTVLATVDVGTGTVAAVCPAGAVAVAAGTAAFLEPENAGPMPSLPACTAGDLNGDGDTADQVVQLLPAGGTVHDLGVAATAVALSARCTGGTHAGEVCDDATLDCGGSPCTPTLVAALVSEAGQGAGGTILNGDGDTSDTVVELHQAADLTPTWTNTHVAADTLAVAGGLVGFLVPEAAQGAGPLNGDGDTTDRVLDLWDTDGAGLLPTGYAAEDFVLGTPHPVSCTGGPPSLRQYVAFRVNEAAQGAGPLNGDGDTTDDVLFVYDVAAHAVIPTGQAVVPCRLQACDPREPYRVFTHSVKFLTREADQGPGGTDLNHDGDTLDTVIQVFDVCSGVTTTVGTLADASDTAGADTNVDPLRDQAAGGQVFVGAGGRCMAGTTVLLQPGSCATTADCPPGATCVVQRRCYAGTDVLPSPPSCTVDGDCPTGATCQAEQVGVASSDADEDGVPDAIDNCPTVPNATQQDTDHDGVGDACDSATCGNGVVEPGEQCDGGAGCRADCTAVCGTTLGDPTDSVKVVTKKAKGALAVKLTLPLPSYAGEPVDIRLDDADTSPIARRTLLTVPPKGKMGTTFQFKAKGAGLQQLVLRAVAPATFLLKAKAKQWFTAAAADEPAASTRLTITVGSQCFTRAVTKKTD